MTSRDEESWPEGLDDALRRRAARRPAISPQEASRRVRARIGPRPRRRGHLMLLAGATAVALALAGALGRRDERWPPTVERAVTVEPLPDNIVLWWLDPETPVYFVVGPPTTHEGGPS